MDVSEILKLLATLSIGLDDPTDSDIVVFMQFINLCYFEILQETISQSPLVINSHERLNCTDGVLDPTDDPIFIPKLIYDIARNVPLTGTIAEEIEKEDPAIKKTGTPQQWYYKNGVINVYPLATSLVSDGGGFGVKYIRTPEPLTQYSTSSEIFIPTLYQQILADGAAYYVFQSETGFKDQTKMKMAMDKWEMGKKKIFTYMKNICGKKYYSTYSAV